MGFRKFLLQRRIQKAFAPKKKPASLDLPSASLAAHLGQVEEHQGVRPEAPLKLGLKH